METLGDAFLGLQRVLVISPHPDDETLGCAGTIARVKAVGGQGFAHPGGGGLGAPFGAPLTVGFR